MRFQDAKLLSSCRDLTRCVWCSRDFRPGHIAYHHIISRGAGGSDLEENLLAVDFICHRYLQESVPQDIQIWWRAWMLRVKPDQLTDFLRAVRLLDKSATKADVDKLRAEIFERAA